MKWGEVALGVAAVGCVAGVVYAWTHRVPVNGDAARTEIAAQQPELDKCKSNLSAIYGAWSAYRKDHKGSEPASVADLFPKYLKDTNVLICPTAKRWLDKNYNMSIGVVKIGGKPVNPSYGFRWLTSGAVRDRKLRGEKAPIVVCQAHTEAIYIAAYKKRIPVGLYTGDRVQNMIPEVKDAKDLAVLRDGSISAINPAEE